MNFEYISHNGQGDEGSTLAHAMAWYNGYLYLGSSNTKASNEEHAARILRYDPKEGSWEILFTSDSRGTDYEAIARFEERTPKMGRAPAPKLLAKEYGIRSLAVFQGKSDPHPCLYAGTLSIFGGRILRSEDGETFEPIVEDGLNDDTCLSFRGLTPFKKKLFTAPAGTVSTDYADVNYAPETMIYVSDDPAAGPESWVPACEPSFGDPVNRGVFSLCVAHGYLYAGTSSPDRGFQLWRTDGKGKAPYKWDRVLYDGAWRFQHNLSAVTLCEFDGNLYIGSGVPGVGADPENEAGSAAAELIRVYKDKSWEIVSGEPRFTPDGLKVPLTAIGPGFDDPYNSAFWSMCTHDGALYIGTNQWEPIDYAMHGAGKSVRGGYQLWRLNGDDTLEPLIVDGDGKVSALGIRTLNSTPAGLFVGTTVHSKLIWLLTTVYGNQQDDLKDMPNGYDVMLARRDR